MFTNTDCGHLPSCRLLDIDHICDEGEALQLELRYEGLEQNVDLRGGLLDRLLDGNRDPFEQLAEFQLLL